MLKAALCAALAASALPAAHAAAQDEPGANTRESRCVTVRNVNGYSVIDDRHVVLESGVNDYVLLTLRNRCSGLRFGASIGTSFGSRATLCPPIVEHVTTSDGWRCAIGAAEQVESVEAARALIERRAAEADDEDASR